MLFRSLLPTCRDLQHFRQHGRWIHATLAEALAHDRHVLDVAVAFARRVPPEQFETLYVAPSRHMNAAGKTLLADLVAERIHQLKARIAAPLATGKYTAAARMKGLATNGPKSKPQPV